MSALLSWLIVLGIFLVVLVGVKQIGAAFDWALDRLRGNPNTTSWVGTDDLSCPCGHDRGYHDREASRG